MNDLSVSAPSNLDLIAEQGMGRYTPPATLARHEGNPPKPLTGFIYCANQVPFC
jgi:hypothetical protein